MVMSEGEGRAWEILRGLDPGDVCRNASVRHESGIYILRSLGMDFSINTADKSIKGLSAVSEETARRLGYFLNHSALWYLIGAKDIGVSGRLVRPSDVRGGHHFFRGTHELPLEGLAAKYGADPEGFIEKALSFGGKTLAMGDRAAELCPFPRIPVILILRLGEDEFPPRADLFFDSTCEMHLPLDIIWSTAMLTALAMLT